MKFLKSKTALTFLALLLTLSLGIMIGTIALDGVFSAEEKVSVAQLKVQGGGTPLALAEEVPLVEGFSKVAKTVEPAVVNISTSFIQRNLSRRRPERRQDPRQDPFRDFFGDESWERFFGRPGIPREQKVESLGSGVIVDSKGYVLTNNHVVAQAEAQAGKISVKLSSGKTFLAEVIGQDPDADVAVLKIDAGGMLPFAKIGDASKAQVGDWVLAIGSPFGLEQTVTSGIISATGRIFPARFANPFGDYLQTDAAINRGNSGGPLIDMRGEVIGINSFISTVGGSGSVGVGFAIPSSVFVNSYNQLVTKGRIERGWLGVAMNSRPMTVEMAEYFGVAGDDPQGTKDGDGVLVTEVVGEAGDSDEGGPAQEAGIRPEDVIVRFGNREIETDFDLLSAVTSTPPGKSVPIVIVRKGEVIQLNVTLAERKVEERERAKGTPLSLDEDEEEKRKEEEKRRQEIGLEIKELAPQEASRLRMEGEEGVLIVSVAPGSLADDAGLRPDQVITHVNGRRVRTSRQIKDSVDSLGSGEAAILRLVISDARRRRKTVAYTSFVKP